ncbi:hypothetical protein GIB67_035061, partial [Kingdonia uniflora]
CAYYSSAQKAVDNVPDYSPTKTPHLNRLRSPPSPGEVGAQAVALRISGEQAAFYNCGFYGAQDTLLDNRGKHYFKECFIQGSIDFIFGNGRSLYERVVTINSIAKQNGAITTHASNSANEKTGFSFVRLLVDQEKYGLDDLGVTIVLAKTYISDVISSDGWNDPSKDSTVFFGEYECVDQGQTTHFELLIVNNLIKMK